MTTESLGFAIDDCKRFYERALTILSKLSDTDELSDTDVKTLTRLSLDVTRALTDLRKEAKPTR